MHPNWGRELRASTVTTRAPQGHGEVDAPKRPPFERPKGHHVLQNTDQRGRGSRARSGAGARHRGRRVRARVLQREPVREGRRPGGCELPGMVHTGRRRRDPGRRHNGFITQEQADCVKAAYAATGAPASFTLMVKGAVGQDGMIARTTRTAPTRSTARASITRSPPTVRRSSAVTPPAASPSESRRCSRNAPHAMGGAFFALSALGAGPVARLA